MNVILAINTQNLPRSEHVIDCRGILESTCRPESIDWFTLGIFIVTALVVGSSVRAWWLSR